MSVQINLSIQNAGVDAIDHFADFIKHILLQGPLKAVFEGSVNKMQKDLKVCTALLLSWRR